MAKGLRNYSEKEQEKVIASRLQHNTGGLGYLSAQEAEYKIRMAKLREQLVKKEVEVKA